MKRTILVASIFLVFGCSSKPDKSSIPDYSTKWEKLLGEYIKKPVDIEINRGLEPVVGNPAFNYQVAISVPVESPMENGLPGEMEEPQLEKLQRKLEKELVEEKTTVFAAVIKTDRKCDFIFYSGDRKAAQAKLDQLGETVNGYTLDKTIKRDDKWVTYTWFSQWKN
ncbi:MAG: DUF695 domain-containing protein [Chitinispirillaceae bacterium]